MPFRRDKKPSDRSLTQTRIARISTILVFTGAYATVALFVSGHPLSEIPTSTRYLILASILLAPFMALVVFEVFNRSMDAGLKGIFFKLGGKTAPPHSEGEAMVHRELFSEAADWFAERVAVEPKDWKAQVRLIEIIKEYLNDPEREAEERSRLLKIEGVPEGLWVQSVFDLGDYWERLERPDRAISVYKGLIWKYPEGVDSDEARRRLTKLEVPGSN